MTNIIRLNESINDYISRPVITALGEPEVAIRPTIYVAGLGANATVEPNQLLIDGKFGQTNSAPFIGVGTGSLSLKSDANGNYLAMNQKGIRTGTIINTKEDKGTLVIMKVRINDIFEGADRLTSSGSGSAGQSNFGIVAAVNPVKSITNAILPSQAIDNKVHTVAMYSTNNKQVVFFDDKKYTGGNSLAPNNELVGVGINTRAFVDTPPNNIDLYNFEYYVDVVLTDQQIADYLLTF